MKTATQRIARVALIVKDYDQAIQYFVDKLDFKLMEDTRLNETKRWVVAPDRSECCQLLLAKASNHKQRATIGAQTGGRVFLFLQTDDFWASYQRMAQRGVKFREQPVRKTTEQ